ncbi:hypothetical protein WICPIJ_005617 [Wickerhamomyces pijperi]|uniref:Uncharacterized protein n=1 Tax=Wickerhamomyces pijperi TaxID=599730 RepID=A0A9P8Q366_WICPI|nr:hypothetical protein WICPIJ_005617 [Wickerhamomyces pijperi]
MADNFQNKYHLATTVNQLQAQKLSQQVFIGPLNTLAQHQFISTNNIRYVIGILPCHKCCYYLKDFEPNQFTCINVDPDFNVQRLTEFEGECLMRFNTKFTPNLEVLTDHKINNSIVTNLDIQKILQEFILIMNCIKQKDPQAGVLLFSLNGNDNLLSLFTCAYVQDSLNCDSSSAYGYLKSIRPSIKEIERGSGYANELLKFEINNKAKKLQLENSQNTIRVKSKRSVTDCDDHLEVEMEYPRSFKRSF